MTDSPKKPEVRITLSQDDIIVTPEGHIKINKKEVANALSSMLEEAKAREARFADNPAAIRVSA